MKNRKTAVTVSHAGLIAAAYAGATWLSSLFGIAYGPVQFRLSEALCVLCVFTPAAAPGLAVGCFIANLSSPYGIADALLGTAATLLAAVIGRALRNIRIKGVPLLSILMPVITNSLIIGAETVLFLPHRAGAAGFLIFAAQIAAGEIAVCLLGGIPLFFAVKRSRIFNR